MSQNTRDELKDWEKTFAQLLAEAQTATNLNSRQAAAYLNMSHNTLDRWRWSGEGPRFHKFGRAVRYRREDLDAWIAASCAESTTWEVASHD